jgi:hypothetical protein
MLRRTAIPACPETETTMPAETITLTQDQAEDLRELLSYAAIPQDWLLHAPSDILNALARFAYHDHFHPCSAARWLTEDVGHLGCRLRKTLPAISASETDQRMPPASTSSQ